MTKYTIQITRWEPQSADIEVEATSKTAAISKVREIAKGLGDADVEYEADTTQYAKVTIEGVITHIEDGKS